MKKNIGSPGTEQQTIIELLGWALGVGGLRFDDFCLLMPFEFQAVANAVTSHDDNRERGEWERARAIGCISLTPWSKGAVSPENVLPLPWDGEKGKRTEPETPIPTETREEAKENLDKLLKRIKKQERQ